MQYNSYITWVVIAIQIVVIFFLIFGNWKNVSVPKNFKIELLEAFDMLIYSLTVGPSEADDVVKRVLTVEVNGELVETRNFEPSATSLGEVGVTEGDNVNLALVDVDDAGNVSEPAFVRFVATDTIAPPAPGAFGATLVRETSRQVPVVESEVTPVVEVVVPSPEEVETPVVEVVSPELDLPEPNIDVIPESPPSGYSV